MRRHGKTVDHSVRAICSVSHEIKNRLFLKSIIKEEDEGETQRFKYLITYEGTEMTKWGVYLEILSSY